MKTRSLVIYFLLSTWVSFGMFSCKSSDHKGKKEDQGGTKRFIPVSPGLIIILIR